MIYVLYAIHVIVCLFLILVVLLQQGKGADLSVFGGGSTQTAFGARGATTLLHKLTVTSFVVFVVTTLAISIIEGRPGTSSVMQEVPTAEAAPKTETPLATPATETTPPAEQPAATPAAPPAADGASTPAPATPPQ